MRPPPRSSSRKKIPSNTTQRHKYLKTILFFSTCNNLQAKGKKTIILHQLQSFSNFTPEWKIQSAPAAAPPAVTISSRSCKLQSAACFSSTH
jgi:hypothetical protein